MISTPDKLKSMCVLFGFHSSSQISNPMHVSRVETTASPKGTVCLKLNNNFLVQNDD
jgi:hypothetical protein